MCHFLQRAEGKCLIDYNQSEKKVRKNNSNWYYLASL